jgi:Zn-dependent protease
MSIPAFDLDGTEYVRGKLCRSLLDAPYQAWFRTFLEKVLAVNARPPQ